MTVPNNRILVVDDEPSILQAYADLLAPKPAEAPRRSSRGSVTPPPLPPAASAPSGCEILTAKSGEEAIALFKAELEAGRRIACGFFDVKMDGGIDGLQTIREIWKLDREMHCTVVTAYHDRSIDDIDHLFGPEFKDQWDYLNKPFTLAEITQKSRQMLAAWNRMRSLETAHAQLLKSERLAAIGQVARGINHEFGNLLQAIMGKADLALQDPNPEKMSERLTQIIRAADRASLILRNLSSFSKGSSTRAPVDMTKVIRETLTLVSHDLKNNTIAVSDQCSPCTPVHGSSAELEQVILNLVINATHAMGGGGTLEIGCKDADSCVQVWVKDTGTGIPSEALPRIFEFAFTTKGDKGSGLGLSISKDIVEKHQGSISVETELGKGTIFLLQFPRHSPTSGNPQ